MCCDLGTPCALRALAKPLATTPSTHAMPRPLPGGSKGQNLRARPEHLPIHALWGGLGSGSNCNRPTRAPSTHHVKGGQGSRVNFSPCLRTLWGNTCHRVPHMQNTVCVFNALFGYRLLIKLQIMILVSSELIMIGIISAELVSCTVSEELLHCVYGYCVIF